MAIAELETYSPIPDNDHPYDEAAAIQRMRDGDTDGFTDIYNEYSGFIRDYLDSKAGHRVPQGTLEDILQDTFLKAFTKFDTYEDRDKTLRPWLVTIAFNNLMNHYRRQARHDKIEGIELWIDTTLSPERPHDTYMQTFACKAIKSYLLAQNILDEDQLHAILAQKADGQSGIEYAADNKIELGTVRSRTSRGMAKISQRFENRHQLIDAVFPDN